jgi:hypothetical protein
MPDAELPRLRPPLLGFEARLSRSHQKRFKSDARTPWVKEIGGYELFEDVYSAMWAETLVLMLLAALFLISIALFVGSGARAVGIIGCVLFGSLAVALIILSSMRAVWIWKVREVIRDGKQAHDREKAG